MSRDSVKNSWKQMRKLSKPNIGIRIPIATSIIASVLFLASGIISIVLSAYTGSNTVALIGLGLIFWGVLFLFISPKRRVDGSLLPDTILAYYSTVDRIIKESNYKGDGYHIPPYPKDVHLPEHLKGLKDPLVFISAKDEFNFPSIEEIAKSKFLLENPKGILVTPPGLGLIDHIEKHLLIDYGKTSLTEIAEILPESILKSLAIAEDIKMTIDDNQIKLQVTNSLYKDLYNTENMGLSISLLGDPIASSVACILSKAIGKPIKIQTINASLEGSIIHIQYSIAQDLSK